MGVYLSLLIPRYQVISWWACSIIVGGYNWADKVAGRLTYSWRENGTARSAVSRSIHTTYIYLLIFAIFCPYPTYFISSVYMFLCLTTPPISWHSSLLLNCGWCGNATTVTLRVQGDEKQTSLRERKCAIYTSKSTLRRGCVAPAIDNSHAPEREAFFSMRETNNGKHRTERFEIFLNLRRPRLQKLTDSETKKLSVVCSYLIYMYS